MHMVNINNQQSTMNIDLHANYAKLTEYLVLNGRTQNKDLHLQWNGFLFEN